MWITFVTQIKLIDKMLSISKSLIKYFPKGILLKLMITKGKKFPNKGNILFF